MRPRVADADVSAMARRMGEDRPELSILVGEEATGVGRHVGAARMRRIVDAAIAGERPDLTTRCLEDEGATAIGEADLAILDWLGVDAAVAAFLSGVMQRLEVETRAGTLRVNRWGGSPPTLGFNAGLGQGARWTTSTDAHGILVPSMPRTLVAAAGAMVEEGLALSRVVSHPALDPLGLVVESIDPWDTGETTIWLAGHAEGRTTIAGGRSIRDR